MIRATSLCLQVILIRMSTSCDQEKNLVLTFSLLMSHRLRAITQYQLPTSKHLLQNQQLLSINIGRSNIDAINAYHLLGEITNQGNNTASFVKVYAIFFDGNHKIVDAVDTFTSPSSLQVGQTAPFDLQSLSPNVKQIKFASINAQSNEYSLINKQPGPSTSPNNNAPLGNITLPATTPLTTGIVTGSGSSDHHHGGAAVIGSKSTGSSSGSKIQVVKAAKAKVQVVKAVKAVLLHNQLRFHKS